MEEGAIKTLEDKTKELLQDAELIIFLRLLGKLNWLCHTRAEIKYITDLECKKNSTNKYSKIPKTLIN